jgi:predicted permease
MSVDWRADLAELFAERRRARGLFYATRRLVVDLASVAVPRPHFGSTIQDVRHALRLFRKHAGVVTVGFVGLGLSIAMCTTVFTVLTATVLRPYGMDDPATVVRLQRVFARGSSTTWPYSAFVELQHGAAVTPIEASLDDVVRVDERAGEPAPPPEPISFVSGGYLAMLGGRAGIGRTLDPADDRPGAPPVVVLSHAYWKHHFNGDAGIVGRAIHLSAGVATVVGVLQPKFSGPVDNPPSFFAPFAVHNVLYSGAAIGPSSPIQVDVIARVPADSSAAQAQLSSVAAGLPAAGFGGSGETPERMTGVQFERAGSPISGPDAGGVYIVIAIIFVVLGLVLALACANVANLLLAGTSARVREFGLRVAMGASRGRLLRQLLAESLLISFAAGAAGFVLSMWLTPVLVRVAGQPVLENPSTNFAVLSFAFVIAVISGLGAGLAPARFGARSDVSGLLKAQSLQAGAAPKASRLRRGFIAFQAAASMLLLVTAALFLRAALYITHADLGFDSNKLLTVSAAFPSASGDPSASELTRLASYWREAISRVQSLPSVEGAALTLYPPFGGAVSMTRMTRDGADYTIFNNRTDSAYFKTAGVRIVRGRSYTAEEAAAGAPVAVVSESLVHEFFHGAEPLGASLATVSAGSLGDGVTIIGVAADSFISQVRGGGSGATYRPIDPKALATAQLIIRASDPSRVVHEVEGVLASIDPQVRPTSSLMRERVDKFMTEPRVLAGLSTAVAVLALVLSVLGIFGVTSFVVGQRTQEVSVRMAIGASAGDVVRLLIRQNMWPVVVGLAAGLGAALLGTRVLTGALLGISPYDPLAIIPAVLVLAVTALAAVTIPALRAARTDPASVLRQ